MSPGQSDGAKKNPMGPVPILQGPPEPVGSSKANHDADKTDAREQGELWSYCSLGGTFPARQAQTPNGYLHVHSLSAS